MLETHGSGTRRAMDAIVVAVFLGALAAPSVDKMLRDDSVRDPRRENRTAQPAPPLPHTLADLSTFPAAFDGHFADTFGLRDVLLRWNSYDKLFVFGISPTPILVFDRGDWIDYAGEETMEVLRGVHPMTARDLAEWKSYFERAKAFCESCGAQYVFVLCPNKETVYPDRVPAKYTHVGPTRFDQLMAALPDEVRACFVDTRGDMQVARARDKAPDQYLYFVSGTHWNGTGTWVTYEALMRKLRADHPEMSQLSLADVDFPPENRPCSDSWGKRMYVPELFAQPARPVHLVHGARHATVEGGAGQRWHLCNEAVAGPRVLMFHDSFGPTLADVFAESCPDLILMNTWLDTQAIVRERPDVVMEVRVERTFRIHPVLLDQAGLVAAAGLAGPQAGAPSRAGARVMVSFDRTSKDDVVVPVDGARLERSGDGLVLHSDTARGGWLIPEFAVDHGQKAWLHVEIVSAEHGTLGVHRRSNESGAWLRNDAVFMPFSAGRSVRTIELPGPDGARALRLGLSDAPAEVQIRVLEVRVSEP